MSLKEAKGHVYSLDIFTVKVNSIINTHCFEVVYLIWCLLTFLAPDRL